MTAAEAKRKTQEVIASREENELIKLPEILDSIEQAVSRGEFSVIFFDIMHPSLINILSAEPYSYSITTMAERCVGGIRTTTINWIK